MNRIRARQRHALYLVGGTLLLTGAAWVLLEYRPDLSGLDEQAARSASAALMKLHGAAAMIALLQMGALLSGHVGAGWKSTRNKASGIASLALAGALVLTGYALYYAGADELRHSASLLHMALGAALPVVLFAHALRLLRSRHRHAALARTLHRRKRMSVSAR